MTHDVFISYRRDGGEHLAGRVKADLKNRGFSVFMDVEDLKSGKFDTALLRKIEDATDVIVILTPGCLDRCKNEEDWLRQEIKHSIKCERNIVPIIARGFEMPLPASLPSDIAELVTYHGLIPAPELFDASMDKLVSTFLKSSKHSALSCIDDQKHPMSANAPYLAYAFGYCLSAVFWAAMLGKSDEEIGSLKTGLQELALDLSIKLSHLDASLVSVSPAQFSNLGVEHAQRALDAKRVLADRLSDMHNKRTAAAFKVGFGLHFVGPLIDALNDNPQSLLDLRVSLKDTGLFLQMRTIITEAADLALPNDRLGAIREILEKGDVSSLGILKCTVETTFKQIGKDLLPNATDQP